MLKEFAFNYNTKLANDIYTVWMDYTKFYHFKDNKKEYQAIPVPKSTDEKKKKIVLKINKNKNQDFFEFK